MKDFVSYYRRCALVNFNDCDDFRGAVILDVAAETAGFIARVVRNGLIAEVENVRESTKAATCRFQSRSGIVEFVLKCNLTIRCVCLEPFDQLSGGAN